MLCCLSPPINFWCFCFRGELGFQDCDDICMCVVNKHCELIEFVLIPFMLTWSIMSSHVVALGLSVRLSWYPMWVR